jgi:alanine dehydrogenase
MLDTPAFGGSIQRHHAYRQALLDDAGLLLGLNTHRGRVTCKGVAEALDLPFTDPAAALAG